MGRSVKPKYSLEMDGVTSASWAVSPGPNRPGKGRPTAENLEKYVMAYIDSLKPGGVNYHVSKALGYMPVPNWARIVLNDLSRQVVAEWKAPAFMVI